MAEFQMPNVDGMNSMDELKNAVGKMAKELGWLLNNIDWKNINELNISLNGGASVNIANEGITVNDGANNTFTVNRNGEVTMTGATIQNFLNTGFVRISDEGIKVNNGQNDTFVVDMNGMVKMTGAQIQSSENGYPRVEMNSNEKLFAAYASATNYIQMLAVDVATGSPQFRLVSPVGSLSLYQQANVSDIYGFNSELRISAQRDIILKPGLPANYIRMPFEQVLDTDRGTSLFTQLLSKASSGVSTGLSGGHNHGIPDGTELLTADGGKVTFFGANQHSHAQN